MPNIGPAELILVLVIALIVLGPKRLPGAGRSLGTGIREFKEGISGAGAERRCAEPREEPTLHASAERAGQPAAPASSGTEAKDVRSGAADDVPPGSIGQRE